MIMCACEVCASHDVRRMISANGQNFMHPAQYSGGWREQSLRKGLKNNTIRLSGSTKNNCLDHCACTPKPQLRCTTWLALLVLCMLHEKDLLCKQQICNETPDNHKALHIVLISFNGTLLMNAGVVASVAPNSPVKHIQMCVH